MSAARSVDCPTCTILRFSETFEGGFPMTPKAWRLPLLLDIGRPSYNGSGSSDGGWAGGLALDVRRQNALFDARGYHP